MLKNTLCNVIENLIVQYQLTPYQQKKIKEFFQYLKEGDFIYAGHLKSKLSIDILTAYKILEDLKRQGILKNLYEVYCFECSKSKGIFLESLADFNEETYCDFCEKKLSIEDNIIVLYKVVSL